MMTLIPMWLEDIMMWSIYLMYSEFDLIKMSNLNMGSSNNMGFRVIMVDHMYLWAAR